MPAESSSIPAPATWALVAGAVADPRPLACRQDELAETGCVDSPSFLFCSHEATSSGEMYVCRFSLVSGVSAKDHQVPVPAYSLPGLTENAAMDRPGYDAARPFMNWTLANMDCA
jgi:hypothetical protein